MVYYRIFSEFGKMLNKEPHVSLYINNTKTNQFI